MTEVDDWVTLTADDAIAMLPDGDYVHTFLGSVGADWSREEAIDSLRKSKHIGLSGAIMTAMDHGVCFWRGSDENGRWIFMATKEVQHD